MKKNSGCVEPKGKQSDYTPKSNKPKIKKGK